MGRLRKILDNPTELAPRATRRRLGIGVAILLAALFGWTATKHVATGGLSGSAIEAGLDDLAVALNAGDDRMFDRAEEQFVKAASVSVIDPYPAFLIQTARRLRTPNPQGGSHDQIALAVVSGDLTQARSKIEELEHESQQASELWGRLLDELSLRLEPQN